MKKENIRELELKSLPKNIDFVVGSPPCTTFSYANKGGGGDIADGLKDLNAFKEQVYEEISDLQGSLIIKEYATKSATTQTIRTHLEKLKKRGIHPDIIIVDYADILRPVTISREKRHDLENLNHASNCSQQTK